MCKAGCEVPDPPCRWSSQDAAGPKYRHRPCRVGSGLGGRAGSENMFECETPHPRSAIPRKLGTTYCPNGTGAWGKSCLAPLNQSRHCVGWDGLLISTVARGVRMSSCDFRENCPRAWLCAIKRAANAVPEALEIKSTK
jgi:hypothetical protein